MEAASKLRQTREQQDREGQIPSTLAQVVPLFGRDEMNLLEFPLGPISQGKEKSFQIEHRCIDQVTKRPVLRTLLVTGSDAHGLPRPVDDQVLLGMKAVTSEAGFAARKVYFSQYQLCKAIGWEPSGRSYKRLEESLDRIAATTFKFKNAWWDRGNEEWRSHTFHLIDNLELSSRGRYENHRRQTGRRNQRLCYFVWNEVVWKSFTDGFIKKVDMEMFRRIAKGRRREVPLRLFRWLDKQFYRRQRVSIDLEKLCYGTLGLRETYPSELRRITERASQVLLESGFLGCFEFNGTQAVFLKHRTKSGGKPKPLDSCQKRVQKRAPEPTLKILQQRFPDVELNRSEAELLATQFGTGFERKYVQDEIRKGRPLDQAGPVRLNLLLRYLISQTVEKSE